MPVLQAKDLKYYYFSDHIIFENLDLSFERGKVYVILGASGSGKTTLLSLLGGLDAPKGGEILFEGKNIAEMGLEKYRHDCVSFVFQNYNLIEYMTPRENVQLVDAHATADTLHQVGLTDEEIDRNVLQLSGGQQQRVAIARALASAAPVILADEPTGSLDEDTAHDVTELLVGRARSLNKCVIIVSHSNEVAAAGDVILRFSHGEIEVS
ncbi:ATP-binding cassette domain-containing protein [Agathobaculum sp. Marseille-P7918]|uniref:ATP-binding cassette domain-containing protein n=1 Tax=Agathobaculum sp. Marseille-P7918 TaxID=2479843 RepID=UPI0035628D3B